MYLNEDYSKIYSYNPTTERKSVIVNILDPKYKNKPLDSTKLMLEFSAGDTDYFRIKK